MSTATTEGIEVQVTSHYHPERSAPEREHWFFSYTVQITNIGTAPARLVARHWVITNARGEQEEVHGLGVVGEQPYLTPGTSFAYTSFCPLDTSMGSMHGSYRMVRDGGASFEAEIAPFVLADPVSLN